MKNLLLVFVGGGFGSSLRYLIGKHLNPTENTFPWGTFTANLIGSLIIGIVFGWVLQKSKISNDTFLLIVVGFCGGFTTFSAFANESLSFLKTGHFSLFLAYVLSSLILGIFCVWLGYLISAKLI